WGPEVRARGGVRPSVDATHTVPRRLSFSMVVTTKATCLPSGESCGSVTAFRESESSTLRTRASAPAKGGAATAAARTRTVRAEARRAKFFIFLAKVCGSNYGRKAKACGSLTTGT